MSETPRSWTLKVKVYEAAPVDAERERMLDLLERLCRAPRPLAAQVEATTLLREHGRLSGEEGA